MALLNSSLIKNSVVICTIDRIDFSTESIFTSSVGLLNNIDFSATSSNLYGYFGGGGPDVKSTISRLDFSTETVTTPTPKLSQAKSQLTATSSDSCGYFAGGLDSTATPPVVICTIDRLDFSTETVSVPTSKLSQARRFLAATSSSSYGYFSGGDLLGTPPVS